MRAGFVAALALLPCLVVAQTATPSSGLPALKEDVALLQSQVNELASKTQVTTEATSRIAADAALQAQIDQLATKPALATEATARTNADATEIANRTNADTSLQDQITQLQATIASMSGSARAPRFSSSTFCTTSACTGPVIPSGKVFVMELLSARVVASGATFVDLYLNQADSSVPIMILFPCVIRDPGTSHSCIHSVAANLSGQLKFAFYTSGGSFYLGEVFMSGYLVDAQ